MVVYKELESPSVQSPVIRAHIRQEAMPEEVLIPDDRGRLSPGQMIENKLYGMLPGASLPVSQLRYSELILRRS